MTNASPPKLEYPCSFPVKIFIRPSDSDKQRITSLVTDVAGQPVALDERISNGGKYMCLSVAFPARDEAHIELLREKLAAEKAVILSL